MRVEAIDAGADRGGNLIPLAKRGRFGLAEQAEPVLDEPGLVEMLKRRGWTLNQARIYPLGALTAGLKGEKLAEMLELADAGCIGWVKG